MSPILMNELFAQKIVSYDLRNDNVQELPRYNIVTYGFNHQGIRV